MTLGPLKTLMASAAAVGAVATGPLTGNAIAEDAQLMQISGQRAPLAQAGDFGMRENNVGVLMYYGYGNGSSPDDVGNYIVEELEAYALKNGEYLNADYFVQEVPGLEGIRVAYHIGGSGVASQDIRMAITEDTFADVVEKRETANRTLTLASLER